MIVVCSPYRGDRDAHIQYARLCVADAIGRGELPIAPHLLFTQPTVVDDRDTGIHLSKQLIRRAELVAVYLDFGVSDGMAHEIDWATALGVPVDHRRIGREYQIKRSGAAIGWAPE